jgi:putative salt-induced outer membrane protein YdiY
MLTRPVTVTGGANMGFLSTGGNTDVNNLRIDADAVIRSGRNRYTLGGVLNRGADSGVQTARNATVSGRYDRFINPRLFANATALFTRDQFREVELRSAIGLGIGYQVADNARVRFAMEGGYGYVDERFAVTPDSRYQALRENATIDVFALGKRVTFFHRQDGFFGFSGDDDLFVQTRNGVRLGLIGGLVATVQFDLDYDPSPPPGRTHTDRSAGLTFGYRF